MQGHPVIFGQNFCYIREENCLFYLKSAGNQCMMFVKYSMTCGDPGICNKVTGHCYGSCLAGWEGDMCENGKRRVHI